MSCRGLPYSCARRLSPAAIQASRSSGLASISASSTSPRQSVKCRTLRSYYMRPALKRAKIEKPFRPWHDLRHTALTREAAAGNPQAYVQMKAGHSQGSITERYIHAAQVLFPGAAEKAKQRMFGEVEEGAAA